MSLYDSCLIRTSADGEIHVRLGVALLDEYLEFVASRCRPRRVP